MSVAAGFRHTLRLHKVVVTVWLVSVAMLLPLQLVVQMTAGSTRANLPAEGLPPGEDLVVFFETIRPVVVPFVGALTVSCIALLCWWILWHAGCAHWYLQRDHSSVKVAGILGDGLTVWWRFARLVATALVLNGVALATCLLLSRVDIEASFLPALVVGSLILAFVGTALVWLAALRGMWLLGQTDRRSAVLAWLGGLATVARQPLRSILPVLVWAIPGGALLLAPVIYDGPAPTLFLLTSWLVSAFCWVALHLSFAPQQPPRQAEVSPLEPPTAPYTTTRFPTLLRDE